MRINEIGYLIAREWKNPNFAALPYIKAMQQINQHGKYMTEDWDGIVLRFLGNAGTWRGPVAKEVKKELKEMLKGEVK